MRGRHPLCPSRRGVRLSRSVQKARGSQSPRSPAGASQPGWRHISPQVGTALPQEFLQTAPALVMPGTGTGLSWTDLEESSLHSPVVIFDDDLQKDSA